MGLDLGTLFRIGVALADPTRRRVLVALTGGPAYPAEMAEDFGTTRANLSNHLACLRQCGLVTATAQGRRVRYDLADPHLTEALRILSWVTLGWLGLEAGGRDRRRGARRAGGAAGVTPTLTSWPQVSVGTIGSPSASTCRWFWTGPRIPTASRPRDKEFRHVKSRKAVEPVARPAADAQRLYKRVIAQVAVRTVREVFAVCPEGMVSTVVFNGRVDTVDPVTGRKTQPMLISVRATREKFDELVLGEPRFDPVASITRHFFAAISSIRKN